MNPKGHKGRGSVYKRIRYHERKEQDPEWWKNIQEINRKRYIKRKMKKLKDETKKNL